MISGPGRTGLLAVLAAVCCACTQRGETSPDLSRCGLIRALATSPNLVAFVKDRRHTCLQADKPPLEVHQLDDHYHTVGDGLAGAQCVPNIFSDGRLLPKTEAAGSHVVISLRDIPDAGIVDCGIMVSSYDKGGRITTVLCGSYAVEAKVGPDGWTVLPPEHEPVGDALAP